MNKLFLLLSALLLMSACSQTASELEQNPNTLVEKTNFNESYQSVYRKIVTLGRKCADAPIGFNAALKLDADLYTDLGYGEIAMRLSNWGVNNYYWKAVIKKTGGSTSTLTVHSGNTVNNNIWLERVNAWANGHTKCQRPKKTK